ncbi:MAG TPA: amidohydrolase [Chitinophagales bacterium]|nr:amidohydrolase [Chitinophagales bacterium]
MKIDYDTLKQFRRTLHANPEVSESEIETAKRVTEFLKNCNPDELITEIGGTGIIATWNSGNEGNEIVFRAELDALPIKEINTFDYASTIEGVSHKCGHDGHATILCGLAKYLSANKTAKGKVRLLFQPAEENGEGAKAMLADEKFKNIQPDYIFALHNLPAYPLHQIVVKENNFTAAVNSIIINLHGKTSHAAEPENGINPALAVAEIITQSIARENNNPEKEDMRVITPVFIELGEKSYGVSAGDASVHLTLRCLDNTHLRQLEKDIETLSKAIAVRYNLKIDFEYTQTFFANVNDKSATALVKQSAMKNNLAITERSYPFKWGEDFGLFTTKFKGCMFGLGAGENTPALHNPDYDFPDALLETGVRIFSGIIDQLNTNN